MRADRIVCLLFAFLSSYTEVFAEPVLLISIDGLHPEYVIDADRHGVRVPHLRSFVADGAYASGVTGVVPTITYPSHTTMLTGVAPARHGITSNTSFDPLGTNRDGWFWYAEDIGVPTLWTAVAQAGGVTASVNWPVTVGNRDIRFLLPEYWRASNSDDLKLMRALSRPEGILEQLEARLGPFVDGYMDAVAADEVRTRFALALLRQHRPQFMAVHLIALDGTQHSDGPFVPSAYATLEAIDGMVGELGAAALANDPASIVAVVSDHGFIATHTAVNLRTRLAAEGLIRLEEAKSPDAPPAIASWDAQAWSGGAVAAVMLRDRHDDRVRARVAALLATLRSEPRHGIARVLTPAELAATGGFPEADFLVEFAPGYYMGGALRGELLTPAGSKGTHGYLPDRREMHAAFFVKGQSIARGRALGIIDMREIGPTLAALLGVDLAHAEKPALPLRASTDAKR